MNPETSIPAQGQDEQEPVLSLIKQIKENRLNPKSLSAEERRRCVDVLGSEGYTVPQIAEILKHGERTIHRDRTHLREAHALQVHPNFALQLAGELMRQTEYSIARLRKLARETTASVMERCMAENFALKAHLDMLTKLQSMGFAPRVPNSVVAQVVGVSPDLLPTLEQAAQRLAELERVDEEMGISNPEDQEKRRVLKELIEHGHTAVQINQMIERFKGN